MRLKEIMTRGVETVSIDDTIEAAARRMRDDEIGFLAVVDDDNALGTLTDRDIVVRAVAAGCEPRTTHVGEIMSHGTSHPGEVRDRTSAVESLHCDEDVRSAVEMMRSSRLRRVLVHDDDYRIIGVVSSADLAGADSQDRRAEAEAHAVGTEHPRRTATE